MVKRKVVFPLGLPSCVDFDMHTWDDWALAAPCASEMQWCGSSCLAALLAACKAHPRAVTPFLSTMESCICGHNMSKGTWDVSGRRWWSLALQCPLLHCRHLQHCKGAWFPQVAPNRVACTGTAWGTHCRWRKASQLANSPLQGVNQAAKMLPSTSVVQ